MMLTHDERAAWEGSMVRVPILTDRCLWLSKRAKIQRALPRNVVANGIKHSLCSGLNLVIDGTYSLCWEAAYVYFVEEWGEFWNRVYLAIDIPVERVADEVAEDLAALDSKWLLRGQWDKRNA